MQNKLLLSALAMDLKRVALGLHRKSYAMAERFLIEALRHKEEIRKQELLPYMQLLIDQVGLLHMRSDDRTAEDALMLSTRIQNYVLYK